MPPLDFVCQYVVIFTRVLLFFFSNFGTHRDLHSFPTRRSSDLTSRMPRATLKLRIARRVAGLFAGLLKPLSIATVAIDKDRKSTRLNSSHRTISYAVFCLKKKK